MGLKAMFQTRIFRCSLLCGFSPLLCGLTSLLLVQNCRADRSDDFYIQQALERYFVLPQDARSLSMGGSADLTCRDASCIYLNPAGLAHLRNIESAFTIGSSERTGDEFLERRSIEEHSDSGYGVVGVPFGQRSPNAEFGVLALGYSRYQGEVNDRIASTPDGHRRSIGYGYGGEAVALGYAFTFYDDQIRSALADLHSHARFLHSFGVQAGLTDSLTAGATFKLGIGQSDTEELSTHKSGLSHLRQYTASVGLAQRWSQFMWTAAIDYSYMRSRGDLTDVPETIVIGGDEEGDVYGIHSGAELKVTEVVPVRVGLRWYKVSDYSFENDNLSDLSGGVDGFGYSSGIGYILKTGAVERARLDYAAEYFTPGHGGWQHLITLNIPLR